MSFGNSLAIFSLNGYVGTVGSTASGVAAAKLVTGPSLKKMFQKGYTDNIPAVLVDVNDVLNSKDTQADVKEWFSNLKQLLEKSEDVAIFQGN